jgi:hypothetical protein
MDFFSVERFPPFLLLGEGDLVLFLGEGDGGLPL